MSDQVDALILFGITGDLAKKELLPALYDLTAEGILDVPVIGVDGEVFRCLVSLLDYVAGDYRNRSTFTQPRQRAGRVPRNLSYLAIPPSMFDEVVTGLGSIGFNTSGGLMLEKPFGRDTASATVLNNLIHSHYPEDRVYRIDHFLGKEAVQNLLVFRFANTVLEPNWNRHYVSSVQITLAESLE